MGNWQLEIFKFSLYVFAPVASFYIYHKVDFFNNELETFQRKYNTPQLLKNEKQIQQDLEFLNSLREDDLRKKFESQAQGTDTKH